MNRRDFLHPRQLASNAGQILGAIAQLDPEAAAATDVALVRHSRPAMATTFEVLLPFGTPAASAAAADVLDLVDYLEQQLTVYRESSEVSRLNRQAAEKPTAVEEGLFELLRLAARIHEETGGAYDITCGALSKAWGFYQRCGRVPSTEEWTNVLSRTGMQHLELDPVGQTVRYRKSGIEINLGSIGKGYALDRVAAQLNSDWKIPSALLHGGRSSVYGLGTPPDDKRGWLVGVRHPWATNRRMATVRLRDRGLATSAATFQHLEHQGRKLGHILDPRTGWTAEGVASATVVAPTAAEADALSTAFFIMGKETTSAYCAAHPEVSALLLLETESTPCVYGENAGVFSLVDLH